MERTAQSVERRLHNNNLLEQELQLEEEQETKLELQQLENFYINARFEDMDKFIQKKKDILVKDIINFQEKFVKRTVDRKGRVTQQINPYLVSTYFFKPIIPLSSKEVQYSAEKLSIIWDLYMYLVENVNMYIGVFQPTLTHFAKFAGISLYTFNALRNSGDEDLMIICEKIKDECFNGNVTLAQNGILNEKSTISRMKIENQATETSQPQIKVNFETKVDFNEINKRIAEIKKYNGKVIDLDKKRGTYE